jgi:hypothetical protein
MSWRISGLEIESVLWVVLATALFFFMSSVKTTIWPYEEFTLLVVAM